MKPVFPESPVQPERIELSKMFDAGEITLDQYRAFCALLDKNLELFNLLVAPHSSGAV